MEWSAEACPDMGLSWPAAQENIPTTQGAAWPGQTRASRRVRVVRKTGRAIPERDDDDEDRKQGCERDLLGKNWM